MMDTGRDGDLPLDRITRPVLSRASRLAMAAAALPAVGLYVAAQRVAGAAQGAAQRLPPAAAPPPGQGWGDPGGIDQAFARVMAVPSPPSRRGRGTIVRYSLHDWPLMLLTAKPEFAGVGFRYPRAFRHRVLPGADGEPIAAITALRHGAPGVLIAHGAMTTKGFDYVRRAAVRLWRSGFSVVAIDLRGFGATMLATEAPSSLGFKEGEDLVALGDWLRGRGAPSVAALGYSLGGAAALNAARVASERGSGLEGGVLALSPPTDLLAALDHLSQRPAVSDPLFATWLTLRAAATARARSLGAHLGPLSPLEAARLAIPAYYGIDATEAAGRSSALAFASSLRVPVLVLHAEDDFVVPIEHARRLAEAAAGNPWVRVLIRARGGHTAFDSVDRDWLEAVEQAWFGTLRGVTSTNSDCK